MSKEGSSPKSKPSSCVEPEFCKFIPVPIVIPVLYCVLDLLSASRPFESNLLQSPKGNTNCGRFNKENAYSFYDPLLVWYDTYALTPTLPAETQPQSLHTNAVGGHWRSPKTCIWYLVPFIRVSFCHVPCLRPLRKVVMSLNEENNAKSKATQLGSVHNPHCSCHQYPTNAPTSQQ
jgi:hypothetical protein